jgi:4-amino-4-deoxy-L-arabinose transferase-like glycosyltransferase
MSRLSDFQKLFIILIFGLSLRLFLFLAIRPWNPIVVEKEIFKGDARGYHQLGISLLKNHQFNYILNEERESLRTPIYPLMVALLYKLILPEPWVVLLFQVFLDTITCYLYFIFLNSFLSNKVALLGCLMYAIDPYLILFASRLWSESFFILFLILGALSFSKFLNMFSKERNILYLVGCGMFIGIATLTKPIAFYLSGIFVVILLSSKTLVKYSYRLLSIAIFLLSFTLVLAPWIIRNTITFGSPRLSTSGGFNLLALYVAPMEAIKYNVSIETIRIRLFHEADSLIEAENKNTNMTPFKKEFYWEKLAFKYIKENPYQFIKSYIKGVSNSFFVVGVTSFLSPFRNQIERVNNNILTRRSKTEIVIGILLMTYLIITYSLSLIGALNAEHNSVFFLCMLIFIYFIASAGPAGYLRFRLPAIPFYSVYIGVGIESIYKLFKGRVTIRK